LPNFLHFALPLCSIPVRLICVAQSSSELNAETLRQFCRQHLGSSNCSNSLCSDSIYLVSALTVSIEFERLQSAYSVYQAQIC